jgi:hypothetical protein
LSTRAYDASAHNDTIAVREGDGEKDIGWIAGGWLKSVRSVADHRSFPILIPIQFIFIPAPASARTPPYLAAPTRARLNTVPHGVFHDTRHTTPAIGAGTASDPLVRVL